MAGPVRSSAVRRPGVARRALVALELVTGVTGLVGGVLLAAAPDGSSLRADPATLAGSPFSDWRVPGVLLAGLVGGGFLLAGWWQWRGHRYARELSVIAGPAGLLRGRRAGLQRDRMRTALSRRAGIGATDLDALEHLEADGPLTQRDLGERLSLTSGAVTMLVDRLERAGWVHRRPHPGDRRYVLIELSPRAAASAPEGLAAYHARIRALAARVPPGQREAVAAFLAAAAAAAAAAVGEISR